MIDIRHGDCLDVLRTMPDNSVDSVCTDPPYGLSNHGDISAALTAWLDGEVYQHGKKGFMGKDWDGFVPGPEVWREVLRVLKPGGHALVFAGTRTVDLMGIALRLAGFEVRDCLSWLYATGFPKGHDISKAIDRMAGAEREVVGTGRWADRGKGIDGATFKHGTSTIADRSETAPATPEAQQWDGWNTALKPAHEPILLVRKPLSEPTIAANVLEWSTGGLNVDGCRIGTDKRINAPASTLGNGISMGGGPAQLGRAGTPAYGRWPANLLIDEHAADLLDEMSGERKSAGKYKNPDELMDIGSRGGDWSTHIFKGKANKRRDNSYAGKTGGASRFFFVAKASRKERNVGLDGMPEIIAKRTQAGGDDTRGRPTPRNQNFHPTVKPLTLLRHLVKLITPPGGVCLDPFAGSGTTGMACVHEGFDAILIEREEEYVEIARRRVAGVVAQREMEIA